MSDNGGLDRGGGRERGVERAVPRDMQVVEYSGHGRSALGSEGATTCWGERQGEPTGDVENRGEVAGLESGRP